MSDIITAPGIEPHMDEAVYHADPVQGGSLSSTEAKEILKSPAHLKHYRENRPVHKPVFDFGSAVHTEVLGTGWPIQPLDFDSFRTKEAREAQAQARAENAIPVLAKDYAEVQRCAAAIRAHPVAGPLFSRDDAQPEISAFGQADGVWLRGRFDLTLPAAGIIVDLKTCQSADPRDFPRIAYNYGYDIQAEHYRQCWRAATGSEARTFIHVLVEKTPPYLVSVVELDQDFRDLGAMRHARALARYRHATENDEWPGYPAGQVHRISPEQWMTYREEDIEESEQ